jgi:hypothetical protein
MDEIERKALALACECAGRKMHHYALMGDDLPLRGSIEAHADTIMQYEAMQAERDAQAAEIARLREAIKTQASAVRTLQANEQTEINILRKQRTEWHHAVSSLDSEREANALLTAEIERLREEPTLTITRAQYDEFVESAEDHTVLWTDTLALIGVYVAPCQTKIDVQDSRPNKGNDSAAQ